MRTYNIKDLNEKRYKNLLKRPAIDDLKSFDAVAPILEEVKRYGLKGALKYARTLDGFAGNNIRVSRSEMKVAGNKVSPELKKAILTAYKNIYKFHTLQIPRGYSVETMPGIICSREFRAVENVGLYIPGGNAVLFSTLLMLAIPAKLAGCKRVVVCSPSKDGKIADELLYTASVCGIKEFYKIGGAQAVALMAYGSEKITKVNKIFGPGNRYVTAAKTLVSIDRDGCAIDMPAGPSEVLVIADKSANPAFAAADLLSQAEHGHDSQAILITTGSGIAEEIKNEIIRQFALLPRKKEMKSSLKNSFILISPSIKEAIKFSNNYAPEHLILNVNNPDKYKNEIINAGSVFTGAYSTESAGDYASGTNHSLPTYGYAKTYSGVNVEQFMKSITFQKLSLKGLKNISKTIITMAETEKLQAHAEAVKVRLK